MSKFRHTTQIHLLEKIEINLLAAWWMRIGMYSRSIVEFSYAYVNLILFKSYSFLGTIAGNDHLLTSIIARRRCVFA